MDNTSFYNCVNERLGFSNFSQIRYGNNFEFLKTNLKGEELSKNKDRRKRAIFHNKKGSRKGGPTLTNILQ